MDAGLASALPNLGETPDVSGELGSLSDADGLAGLSSAMAGLLS